MLLDSIVVYRGNPEAPLAKQERKLKAAAARRKEVNRVNQLTKSRSGSNIFGRVVLSEND